MATELHNGGLIDWGLTVDEGGHREYFALFLIRGTTEDGPYTALRTAGLPIPGSIWSFKSDQDIWAFCKQQAEVTPVREKEQGPHRYWTVKCFFSTKPPTTDRCGDVEVGDPLLEQPKISWGSVAEKEEGSEDRHGNPIQYSSHELIRGPQNEWDAGYTQVSISANFPFSEMDKVDGLTNYVNSEEMWGLPIRSVKFNNYTQTRNFYGNCSLYYTRAMQFGIKLKENPNFGDNEDEPLLIGGWDRVFDDEGTKVLNGHWDPTTGIWVLDNIDGAAPNPGNPSHFIRATGRDGVPMKMLLDGRGKPALISVPRTYYVNIQTTTGTILTNAAFWLANTDVMDFWDAAENYIPGDIVIAAVGGQYLCLVANVNDEPPSAGVWFFLQNGIKDKGQWDATKEYTHGDRVFNPDQATTQGKIRVEKYFEADLLIELTLPTDL